MAKSTNQFNGEILHFNAVRMRVTGIGDLLQTMSSLDGVNTFAMIPFSMVPSTNRELTTLSNLNDQRGQFIIETEDIDEYFIISKIVIYVKPVATGYPQ